MKDFVGVQLPDNEETRRSDSPCNLILVLWDPCEANNNDLDMGKVKMISSNKATDSDSNSATARPPRTEPSCTGMMKARPNAKA